MNIREQLANEVEQEFRNNLNNPTGSEAGIRLLRVWMDNVNQKIDELGSQSTQTHSMS
ncbi:hypothetical protein [Photobacterium halotolerans]|uniref:Uncharacterized protein n=1 Tax=Photobacterium halotolerans TaxID=265726 RepID=A0A7X4W9D8_9GAMM|nr:hypothetical protein [Photobacterium halotolerans]NAW64528.1 hypothetical protein [Photobacterium halotolerans]